MEQREQQEQQARQQKVRSGNLRTGLILASIAVVFFVGIFVKRMWFS